MDAVMERRVRQRLRIAPSRTDKACGKSYIPDDKKCSQKTIVQQSKSETPEQAPSRVEALHQSKDFKKLPDSLKAIAVGAAMVGLSVGAYQQVRDRYRAGFEKSAQMAERISKHVKVPDLPDSKQAVTFTVGGFYGYEGEAGARKGEDYLAYKMATEILGDKDNPGGDHHVVNHRNTKFNVTQSPVGGAAGHVRDTVTHYATLLETTLRKGRNPQAVKLAAEVMAYSKKYPDKEINLVGHSAGGMISHEAAEILNKRGIKVKTIGLGTGYFGLTEKVGESHTIAFHDDMYLHTIPGTARDAVWLGDRSASWNPERHRVRAYMNDKESRNKIRELLQTKRRGKTTASKDALHLDAPPNCTTGERCGNTCIDPKDECNLKNISPEVDKAIDDLSTAVLGAIPGLGQIIAAKKMVATGKAAIAAVKSKNLSLTKKLIMSAVILAGISYLGYQKYRDHRRNAVNESANIARTTANGVATIETSKAQITFTLDGKGTGGKLKQAMAESGFEDHEVIDFSKSLEEQPDFSELSERDRKIAQETENARNFFGSLTSGRNNHAVDLAAQILAYQEKYPGKIINVVAHGAAAQVAVEAVDIAKKANNAINDKLKVVGLQAPDYGIYDSASKTVTVASDRNPATLLPMKNKITFGVEDRGDGTGFFKNKRSLAYLKGYLSQTQTQTQTQNQQQPVTTYNYGSYQKQQPQPTAKPQPANVPGFTMRPVVNSQGQEVTRSVDRQFAIEEIQRHEKQKSQLENNVRSVEGQINAAYRKLETALTRESMQEIEEQITHLTRTLSTNKEKLEHLLRNYKGPRFKQDSQDNRISASIRSLRRAIRHRQTSQKVA
jgi:hypothetical protein